jgi:hypothetical protein
VTRAFGAPGWELVSSTIAHLKGFLNKAIAGLWLARTATCALLVGMTLVSTSCSSASRNQQNVNANTNVKSVEPPPSPSVHIDSVIVHGHIIEISGSTGPGVVVMINGQTASTIFGANAFHHFMGPFPSGTTIITVTAQDEQGGVNTQQIAASIQ